MGKDEDADRPQSGGATPPAADRDVSAVRLETLKELTLALVREVESIKPEESFELNPGFDFAEAVRRFETDLIRWALTQTGGHQRRAARLLDIKVTTLNAKIKRYGIRPHGVDLPRG
jgi:DNA-binding NtrC family response regulator